MAAAKETTLNELGEKIDRGFKAVADDIARIDTRIDDLIIRRSCGVVMYR